MKKLERIARELAEVNNLSLLLIANVADIKNDIKALVELEKHRRRILESITLLGCHKEHIIQFIDSSLEALLFAIDYAEKNDIVLPDYSKLINETIQLLEEINTTNATPHSQHPKNQQNHQT